MEVLIAMSVLSLLGYFMADMIVGQQKAITSSEQRLASIEIFRQIQTALTNREACDRTFKRTTINLSDKSAKTRFIKILSSSRDTLFARNGIYENGNIKLQQMTISNDSVPAAGGEGLANVEITMERQKGTQTGPKIVQKLLKLNVVTDVDGKIQNCLFDREAIIRTATEAATKAATLAAIEKFLQMGGCEYDSDAQTVTCKPNANIDCEIASGCKQGKQKLLDVGRGNKLCCKSLSLEVEGTVAKKLCSTLGGQYVVSRHDQDICDKGTIPRNGTWTFDKIETCDDSTDIITLGCPSFSSFDKVLSSNQVSAGDRRSPKKDDAMRIQQIEKEKHRVCRTTAINKQTSVGISYLCKVDQSGCKSKQSTTQKGYCDIAQSRALSDQAKNITTPICQQLGGVMAHKNCYYEKDYFPSMSEACPNGTTKQDGIRARLIVSSGLIYGLDDESTFSGLGGFSQRQIFYESYTEAAKKYVDDKISNGYVASKASVYNSSHILALCKNLDVSQPCGSEKISYCNDTFSIKVNDTSEKEKIIQSCRLKELPQDSRYVPALFKLHNYHTNGSGLKKSSSAWHWSINGIYSWDIEFPSKCIVKTRN